MRSRAGMTRFMVMLALAAIVLASCSAGDDAGIAVDEASEMVGEGFLDAGSPREDTATSGGREGADAEDAPAALGDGGVVPTGFQPEDINRDIIFTADVTVAVDDVAAAGTEATRVVEGLGGFLFGQETVGLPEPHSTLTFKIDPTRFQAALGALGSIGEIRTQTITADDVTERIVDLESRIATAEVSVERLRGLIDEAVGVEAIAELEQQLLERETDLETMRGRLRTLEDHVDLATIVVRLTEAVSRPELDMAISFYPGHADVGQSCPGDGSIVVEEGDEATICFELTNTGDMPLVDLSLTDAVLGLETDDLIVVFGDLEAALEPGQFAILAAELLPERSLRTQTRVTAAPVNPDGEVLENRRVSVTDAAFLDVEDPGGLPGFSDGLDASVEALANVGGFLILLAGSLLPFVWVPLVVWLVVRRLRRRHGDMTPGPEAPSEEPREPVGV
jgi:uncharacterized coiled-coil protein SlyX